MKYLHLHMFQTSIWSITTFLLILNLPISFSINLQWYNSCGNYFSCGNIKKVGFPFWGGGVRPKNCGYPELELSCDNDVTTKIEIKGMTYHVLEFNQTSHIIKIAREDFVQGTCLSQFTNTTLDFELFTYATGSQNITVLYGCPSPSYGYGPSTVQGQFTCKINNVTDTAAYPELGALGPSGCAKSVIVPVLKSLAPQISTGKTDSLHQIISQGFDAKYKVANQTLCAECEASKGRCGFDLNKTTCLCPDGYFGETPCGSIDVSAPPPGYSMHINHSQPLCLITLLIFISINLLRFTAVYELRLPDIT